MIAKVLGHTDEAFTRRVYIHTRDIPRFDDIDVPAVQAAGAAEQPPGEFCSHARLSRKCAVSAVS